ncbi:MAG: 50S ribosomal protein L18 [Candidatus Omnitrophica bacterium]|nr:50S ribosomal protein L18 [Candidatus Omnitrophota bacterium]
MFNKIDREGRRSKRHWRIRKRIVGTAEKPRLSVHRSHKNIYLQLVNDLDHQTLAAYSTMSEGFRKASTKGGSVEGSKVLGKLAAGEFKNKGYSKIVFDRGGYLYHGRIRALAEALREGGLEF